MSKKLGKILSKLLTEKIIDTLGTEKILMRNLINFIKNLPKNFINTRIQDLMNNQDFIKYCLNTNLATADLKEILKQKFSNLNTDNIMIFFAPLLSPYPPDFFKYLKKEGENLPYTQLLIKNEKPHITKWEKKDINSFILNIKMNAKATLKDLIKMPQHFLLNDLSHEMVHVFEFLYNKDWTLHKHSSAWIRKVKETDKIKKERKALAKTIEKTASKVEKIFDPVGFGHTYRIKPGKAEEVINKIPINLLIPRFPGDKPAYDLIYYNSPSELQAYATSIIKEIENKYGKPSSPSELLELLNKSQEFNNIYNYLFPENKKLILKRIHQYFFDK